MTAQSQRPPHKPIKRTWLALIFPYHFTKKHTREIQSAMRRMGDGSYEGKISVHAKTNDEYDVAIDEIRKATAHFNEQAKGHEDRAKGLLFIVTVATTFETACLNFVAGNSEKFRGDYFVPVFLLIPLCYFIFCGILSIAALWPHGTYHVSRLKNWYGSVDVFSDVFVGDNRDEVHEIMLAARMAHHVEWFKLFNIVGALNALKMALATAFIAYGYLMLKVWWH